VVKAWFAAGTAQAPDGGQKVGEAVALIKPQFEAGRKDVARGDGVVRDPAIHRRVLTEILAFAEGQGWGVTGLIESPLRGPKGNVEFLAWLHPGGESADWRVMIDALLPPGGDH
jgi:23S rRNA (cytidine1920-2'-O)/16S rRNA (cytidine1409-2'-O)-methyltransferase